MLAGTQGSGHSLIELQMFPLHDRSSVSGAAHHESAANPGVFLNPCSGEISGAGQGVSPSWLD